ncbi:hypothetical protein CR513_15462, partial [Mucuna pruriens]
MGLPFSEQIDSTLIQPQFRELVVNPFNDSQDPCMHLQTFQTQVYINGGSDLLSCKLFLERLEVVDLFDIKQTKNETLKQYLARFNDTMVQVDDPDQKCFVKAFQKGLQVGLFSDSLTLSRPTSMTEIRAQVEKHVEVEEDKEDHLLVEKELPTVGKNCPRSTSPLALRPGWSRSQGGTGRKIYPAQDN